VAVLVDRSAAAVVVLLAVLKAGGVYVPLGTAQPAERLALMLDDLRPAAVIAERRLLLALDAVPVPVLAVDDAVEGTTAAPTDPATLPPGDPERLAYMIYTSGSTGRPKAVMVPHRAYTHHCRAIAEVNRLGPGDTAVLLSALTFDLAMEQIGAILLVGGTLVVSDAQFWAPSEVPDRFAAAGITHVFLTPAYFREVMDAVRHADPRFSRLRQLSLGGEAVGNEDARRWYEAGMDAPLLCQYGPTETTIISTSHVVSPEEAASAAPGSIAPIGRPLPGTRAYVLDEALNPVPVGLVGELCLGGARLGRGYLRRPRLTAEKFVPDPFGDEPGARLYRTGDLARFRPDGVIEYVGRIDAQVKLRGLRIELGEIEAALAGHPAVRAAAVAVREPTPGDRRLVGYVVPREGAAPTPAELRDHLGGRPSCSR
jgi:amino acid adenylation domain-containing protein